MAVPHFPEAGLRFLSALAKHNDRAWFGERKETYRSAVEEPLAAIALDAAARLARKKLDLAPDPRRIVFRIHRDVRFSHDKSPYKTHAGAVLHPHGNRDAPGVLYIHIDPKEPFLAAGFYQPEKSAIAAMRGAIVDDPRAFARVLASIERRGLSLSREGALSRLPRGFAVADPGLEPYVKLTSFIIRQPLARADLVDPGFAARIAAFGMDAKPLLTWGWSALRRTGVG
jgi:uncharacterized protein (TIGR02453 family)